MTDRSWARPGKRWSIWMASVRYSGCEAAHQPNKDLISSSKVFLRNGDPIIIQCFSFGFISRTGASSERTADKLVQGSATPQGRVVQTLQVRKTQGTILLSAMPQDSPPSGDKRIVRPRRNR